MQFHPSYMYMYMDTPLTPDVKWLRYIHELIVLCVGESKVPPVLYPSYSTAYVEAHAIEHVT